MSKIAIIGKDRGRGKFAVAKAIREPLVTVDKTATVNPASVSIPKFFEFWQLMDTLERHGYLRAAMSVVGRSSVGAWWSLRKSPEYEDNAKEVHRKRLQSFYDYSDRTWDNIRDFRGLPYNLMLGVMYLRFFGQAAFEILRNSSGTAVGLDHITGLVVPNVDKNGRFIEGMPAFTQYPSENPSYAVHFEKSTDIVFIINPDLRGLPVGGSDVESLATYTLPIDFYLQVAAREYMRNRDKPELIYSLPPDISDDAFNEFVEEIANRRAGPSNIGKNPIAIQGELTVTELSRYPDSLPYESSRTTARDELLAASGVNSAKLGLSGGLAMANLREMRREFHESLMLPLFRVVEDAFYNQVHVREFGFRDWEFKFNSPDFLTAVERATVHMRYRQMGALSSNEVRYDLGKSPIPGGDTYIQDEQPAPAEPGSPPEGRPPEPDAPSQVGDTSTGNQDPVRGDQHDDETRDSVLKELHRWKRFAVRRVERGKSPLHFKPDYVPESVKDIVERCLAETHSVADVVELFDVAFETLEGENSG